MRQRRYRRKEAPNTPTPQRAVGDAAHAAGQLQDGDGQPSPADMIALQQQAGNQAAAELLQRRGEPLAGGVRSELESMFGEPLDDVRVHQDAESASLARSHDADAIAVGQDIAFDQGAYRPGTTDGDALIAHEVAHTIQQRDAANLSPAAFRSERSGENAEEREADGAIAALMKRRFGGGSARMRVQNLRSSFAVRRAALCSKEPSLEEVGQAVDRAEQITSLGAAATSNPEAASKLRQASNAFGELSGHVDTAVNVRDRAQDAWDIIHSLDRLDSLQDDSGAWVDQEAAAVEFGRLFAAAGRIMEATGIPGVQSYGTFLAGASDFFSNMYRKVNVDAIYEDRARRQGPEVERAIRF